MKKLYTFILFLSLTFTSSAQTGIEVPEMTVCEAEFQNFISTYDIPGMTIAMAINGKLSYARAFGKSDIGLSEDMQPYNMLRIASISKPITSIALMKMIENGQLNLSDKVFGVGGLLENHWYFSTINITDSRIYDITVQMLLEHSAGFDSSQNCFPNPTSPYPYFFGGCDPIAAPLHVTQTLGETNPATEEMLVTFLLEKGLDFDPGTAYAYSNMGYLILGEIIEEVSGMSYEEYVKQTILHPLGIYDMHLGKNLLADKMEREGEYIGEGFTNLSVYGDGATLPWEYGGFNLEAFDAHGGWVATARDMVKLLVAIDGFSTYPDILSPASITSMTTPSANNQYYAKGWQVNQYNNWWHTGAVDGTASVWVRASGIGGVNWAIILNKRITQGPSAAFWNALDNLGWNCLYNPAFTTIPAHDFFAAPTANANTVSATNVTDNSMTISWNNGNGTSRIVVANETIDTPLNSPSDFSAYPLDGTDYTANPQFGSGDNLGDDSFVVYNGTGTSVDISGLDPGKEYAIRVYEYNQNTTTGNNALYLLGNVEDFKQSTTSLGIDDNAFKASIKIHPTMVSDVINVTMNNGLSDVDYEIYNLIGKKISHGTLNNNVIKVSDLASGIYLLKFKKDNQNAIFKFVRQ
jgi:CubicO group peptidase (beta-lactamase class C family)